MTRRPHAPQHQSPRRGPRRGGLGFSSLRAAGARVAACLAAGAVLVAGARAQSPAPADAAPAPPAIGLAEEVELAIASLGPGGAARAGSWGGVLVEFRDSSIRPREIVLRLTAADRDGDTPRYERTVVGDPERARAAWLYAPLPFPADADRVTITAHEAIESDTDPDGFVAGRLLGRTFVDTQALLPPEDGLLGVIGTRDQGLRQYTQSIRSSVLHLPLGNEHTRVVTGLTTNDIPDRWQGLAPFSAIVWSRGGPDTDPVALDTDRARALGEWVRRGGHLVVTLPPIGQTWTSAARNPLAALLPAVRIERDENASLQPLRALITRNREARLPDSAVVQRMTPLPEAGRLDAMAILSDPDGRAIVTRRAVGAGMVTLVGIDLTAGLLETTDTLDAEAFWHRVLGRRHSLESFEEVRARDTNLSTAIQQRTPADLDADFDAAIDRRGDSSKGVLLGLVVFAAYWIVAGPFGFWLLSRSGRRGQAWMAFLAVTGLFTALAWLGATALRPKKIEGTHLVFLDEVHGTGVQRASGMHSVLVPRYGDATFAIGEPADANLLAPWAPAPPSGGGAGFPDNRPYALDARRPNDMTVPVRSTIKQVATRWAGDPVYALPRPVGQPGDIVAPSLTLLSRDDGTVRGEVMHDLPGPLERVMVVVAVGQPRLETGAFSRNWLPGRLFIDTLADPWPPGTRLDLEAVTTPGAGAAARRAGVLWLDDAADYGVTRSIADVPNRNGPADRFTALAFASLLSAPDFQFFRSRGRTIPLPVRRQAHELDLSAWTTQPCVIVIGHLVQERDDAGPGPVPLTVDGQPVPSAGRTVVRWIYPLATDPPDYFEPERP